MNGIKEEKITFDKFEKIGKGSLVQHGKMNDRLYLMKLNPDDSNAIVPLIEGMAGENSYTKIIVKIPFKYREQFIENGYAQEALIPDFYPSGEDVWFMSKYFSTERETPDYNDLKNFRKLLESSERKEHENEVDGLSLRELREHDVDAIVEIYRRVFETYPFPIHNIEYILDVMKTHVRFFGALLNGKLIGLCSAEMDKGSESAEMTDFAVLPESRGMKLAYHLLNEMEQKIKTDGIKTAFTIARIKSPSMNKTFINHDYTFAGTLVNNTEISGHIESMNVYYKKL